MGLSILAKSQLSYSIPESMLRLNEFEKVVPKNGVKGKAGRFKIIPILKKGKAFDPPQRFHKYL